MVSEDQKRPPGLARWLFPSIKDILFLGYLLGPLLVNVSQVLDDSDTGWHIRNGEHILENKYLPRADYFSYTNYGAPWFSWEWLSDVILAVIHRYTGLNGVAFWANLTFAITFTFLFWWMVKRGGNIIISVLISRIAGYAAAVHWLARPHLFTLLILLFWYALLEKIQETGTSKFDWALYITILLWVNLHGGFVVGLIMLVIYGMGNLLTGITTDLSALKLKSLGLAKKFCVLTLICFALSFVNPYGYELHKHIADSYFHTQFLLDRIVEFASPDFHTTVVKFFEFLLISALIVFGTSALRLSFIEIGLVVFWTHMALLSVRHVPLYTLIVAPIVVRCVSDSCMRIEKDSSASVWLRNSVERFNRYSRNILSFETQFKSMLYPTLATCLIFWICLNNGYLLNTRLLNASFDEKKFPVRAAQFIETESPKGNMFTTDYWGGYMIYRFYPTYRVFFDGRSDMYGEAFLRKYQKLSNLESSWKDLLEEYKVSWILLPAGAGLPTALKELKDWRIIYDDHQAIIFRRTSDPYLTQ